MVFLVALCPAYASVVRRRPSQSEAVICLENGLTKNHQILHAYPYRPALHSHRLQLHCLLPIGSYCKKKPSKIPAPMALGGISRDQFEPRQPNFTRLLGTIGATNLPSQPVGCKTQLSTVQSGKMGQRIIRLLFDLELPNFAGTPRLT